MDNVLAASIDNQQTLDHLELESLTKNSPVIWRNLDDYMCSCPLCKPIDHLNKLTRDENENRKKDERIKRLEYENDALRAELKFYYEITK